MSSAKKASDKLKQWLIDAEGLKLSVYKDSKGLPTFGIGHLLKKGETFTTINKEDALSLLEKDLRPIEVLINTVGGGHLKQYEFDALVSFIFNIGRNNFLISRTLLYLNNPLSTKESIGKSMLGWGKPAEILPRRAKEVNLFLTGNYDYHNIPLATINQLIAERNA